MVISVLFHDDVLSLPHGEVLNLKQKHTRPIGSLFDKLAVISLEDTLIPTSYVVLNEEYYSTIYKCDTSSKIFELINETRHAIHNFIPRFIGEPPVTPGSTGLRT
jgi:hypothetical protein